jgi:dATP pyrophosphohydrolase
VEVHIAYKNKSRYEFLLLKRNENDKVYPGIWQMITGGIQDFETIREGVFREINEETGINPSAVYSIPRVNSFYFDYGDAICLSPVFLAIAGSKEVTLSEEHTEYKWVDYSTAIELIRWPDQIESLTLIHKYLNDGFLFKKLFKF